MKTKKQILSSLLILAFSLTANATVNPKFDKLAETLKKNNKDMPKIEEINETPVKGVYEVLLGKNDIFYTDETGQYFFLGNLIKNENGKNISLTEERMTELSKIDFKSLKEENAIIRKNGDGKRKLAVFEDPNCGYCRQLESEINKIQNTTIYTYIIPILGKPSLEISEKIWCSKDKTKSWVGYMSKKSTPEVTTVELSKCDKRGLLENATFASKNGVTGTPTIFFEDGTSIKGYSSADEIMKKLNKVK